MSTRSGLGTDWETRRFKFAVAPGRAGGTLIKGRLSEVPGPGLFPAYSASGQDVWVDHAAYKETQAIVVSAVGARCGKCFKAGGDWTAVANTMVLRPRLGYDRDYLWYVLNDEAFWDKGSTAQPYVRFRPSLNRSWRFPPLNLQKGIAHFLDIETAHADRLVGRYQNLLALLREKQNRLVTSVVTGGIDPRAVLRDTGIPWLGKIPQTWELRRVKTLFRLACYAAPPDNEMELLSLYTDIGVRPRKELEERGNKASTTDGYWLVKPGDIIVNKLLAWMGAIAVSDYGGVTSPAYDVLRPLVPLNPRYYDLLFRSGIYLTAFRMHSRGIMDMRLRLYFDELGTIPVPFPPVAEQNKIVNWVASETAPYKKAIALCYTNIETLREHRAALIVAAVTGRINIATYERQSSEVLS